VKLTRKVKGKKITRTVRGQVRKGTARVTLPKKLARGRWTVVTTYAGDANYQAKKARTLRFRVRR
jgi:hypothetical protein